MARVKEVVFKFQHTACMEDIVHEAIGLAFIAGEDGDMGRSTVIAEALLTRVRNYMLTGDPNGRH